MNYLAHVYLADITQTSRVGNFVGDFVKGDISKLELTVEQKFGVYLHRKIDSFTDSHSIVKQSRQRISNERRRYAGIIVDIAYDHYLAHQWGKYNSATLSQFVTSFYSELNQSKPELPAACQNTIPHLVKGNWLENYTNLKGVEFALNGISQRMKNRFRRENPLHNSVEEIITNYSYLESDFKRFFPELVEYVRSLATSNNHY
ncbi:MAG: DUF479 domain-containing protein [Kangiellaceae bacterium]|nr:DUF479 domain-containing protein [Kangiellaceae bacterium]